MRLNERLGNGTMDGPNGSEERDDPVDAMDSVDVLDRGRRRL